MKKAHFITSACRYCRYYQPEGRRGGTCGQLGVPVQASWKACALATPPFESTLSDLKEIVFLETSFQNSLNYSSVEEENTANRNREEAVV